MITSLTWINIHLAEWFAVLLVKGFAIGTTLVERQPTSPDKLLESDDQQAAAGLPCAAGVDALR
jgi:hypothetical protein